MSDSQQPRLLHRVREAIRLRHYSLRTERAYLYWVRRYVLHHGKRHPAEMGEQHVTAFINHLANVDGVAASTQNQALSAVLFLYRDVLGIQLPWLGGLVRAQGVRRIPAVLERHEVRALLERMQGDHGLMARLMYGTGIRIGECVAIRVKDLNLDRRLLTVRDGKGGKDRVTMVPNALVQPLAGALARSRAVFEGDRAKGRPGVELPYALERKYPNAGKMWGWHWLFPQAHVSLDPRSGIVRRHHAYDQTLARAITAAAQGARLEKPVTSHTCGIPSRRTCSTTATTSAPSRSSWGTRT